MSDKVEASPPARVEIRINGRILFADLVYDAQLVKAEDGSTIKFAAALQPVMVPAPKQRPPERFGDDPRDGEAMVERVHSGRNPAPRTRPEPKKAASKTGAKT